MSFDFAEAVNSVDGYAENKGGGLIPANEEVLTVVSGFEEKVSDSGWRIHTYEFTVIDGTYKGRKIWQPFFMAYNGPDKSKDATKGIQEAKTFLRAAGYVLSKDATKEERDEIQIGRMNIIDGDFKPQNLVNKATVVGRVWVQKPSSDKYQPKNRLGSFKRTDAQPPAQSAVSAQFNAAPVGNSEPPF